MLQLMVYVIIIVMYNVLLIIQRLNYDEHFMKKNKRLRRSSSV